MAEGKKSFLLYCDLIHTVKKLPDEKAGQLLKHILSYVNDENPITDDLLIDIAFEPIKHQLKRDLEKWEDKKEGFSDAGKESGKARRLLKPQLYVLRFFNDEEEFLKVGITDYSVGRRYSSSGEGGSKLGYKFEILYQYFPIENQSLTEIEIGVERLFGKFKYVPEKQFGGHTECYNIKVSNDLIKYLTTLNVVQRPLTKGTVNDNVTVNANVTVNDTHNTQEWDGIKKKWMGDFRWKEKICRDKNLSMPEVEKKMDDFLGEIELKEDYKNIPGLKSHFVNWLNKKSRINGKTTAGTVGKTIEFDRP